MSSAYFKVFGSSLCIFKNNLIHSFTFIFGCAGSLLLFGLFSHCGKQGLHTLVAVHGLLIVLVSVVAEHWAPCRLNSCGSQTLEHRLNSFVTQTELLCGMWDLHGPVIKPVSPALAGRLFITQPARKQFS